MPYSVVSDEPRTFMFNRQVYEPGNYGDQYAGTVTMRYALAHSLNIATVNVAEQVGYGRIVQLASQAGFSRGIQPTPAIALGAYEASPLEVAGAFTIFANQGVYVEPTFVKRARGQDGTTLAHRDPARRAVLEPQAAALMRDMLEEVMRSGTGARARSMGFVAPAAGKTGTSRDGWFAGFTRGLLCVVWVGYDDNRDLNVDGAKSALVIWTEFMKRASALKEYAPRQFEPPPGGSVEVAIDPQTGLLASFDCPEAVDVRMPSLAAPKDYCFHNPLESHAADAVLVGAVNPVFRMNQ
jgi:penicillin-binding protein 1B